MKTTAIRWAERVLGTTGILFLGIYGFLYLDGSIQSRVALKEFTAELRYPNAPDQAKGAPPDSVHTITQFAPDLVRPPEMPSRVSLGKLPLSQNSALAELQIQKIALDVPVFPNTSRMSLNRGAGWIVGTATPSDRDGTVGIAGHRDRFFHSLRNINRGDEIVLKTREKVQTFVVDGIAIVMPRSTSLLSKEPRRSLVLVTCYPFSYIGPAPKRFVVHAYLKQEVTTNPASGAEQQNRARADKKIALGGRQ